MTIEKKLVIFSLFLICLFVGTLFFLYVENSIMMNNIAQGVKRSSGAVREVYLDNILTLMNLIESLSFDLLLGPEPEALNQILFKAKQYEAIESIFFLDADEDILADGSDSDEILLLGQPLPQQFHLDIEIDRYIFQVDGNRLIYSKPFDDQGDKLGRLQVIFLLEDILKIETSLLKQTEEIAEKHQGRGLQIMMGVITLVIIVVLILLVFIRRSIVKPLKVALSVAEQLARGNLCVEIEMKSQDEIGVLTNALRGMISKLRWWLNGK